MKKNSTVFLFFVEGPSEEDALHVILDELFDSSEVVFEIVYGDFTTSKSVADPISFLGKRISSIIAQDPLYELKSLRAAVVLTDTDGCYINDDCVIEDPSKGKAYYTLDGIFCNNPSAIQERNKQKSRILNQISSKNYLTIRRVKVPLETYYNSCNLDHLLYDRNNLTKKEKEKAAEDFGNQYFEHAEDFLPFIYDLFPSSCAMEYSISWDEIKKEKNSLHRMSNFICFMIRHSDLLNPEAKKVLDSLLSKGEDE